MLTFPPDLTPPVDDEGPIGQGQGQPKNLLLLRFHTCDGYPADLEPDRFESALRAGQLMNLAPFSGCLGKKADRYWSAPPAVRRK
jgi:hypothetical protein